MFAMLAKKKKKKKATRLILRSYQLGLFYSARAQDAIIEILRERLFPHSRLRDATAGVQPTTAITPLRRSKADSEG